MTIDANGAFSATYAQARARFVQAAAQAGAELRTCAHPLRGPQDEALAGKTVTVSADDYGRDPISGFLVGSTPHQLSILREDAALGAVVVHVPRIGFALQG